MPETTNDMFLARLTQLDDEVTDVNKEMSDIKVNMSGIATSVHSLSSQMSQVVGKLDIWANRQVSSQKTNWAVFAAFMGVAMSMASAVVIATVYLGNLSRDALVAKIDSVEEKAESHATLPSHLQAAVSLERLKGRVMVVEKVQELREKSRSHRPSCPSDCD